MSGYCNDCGNTQCLCKEIEQQEKPTSSCMVDSVVRLKQNVSAVLQEALSGMDAWGDKTRFRDDNGFVRWGLVEKEIYKFIDEANASHEPAREKGLHT